MKLPEWPAHVAQFGALLSRGELTDGNGGSWNSTDGVEQALQKIEAVRRQEGLILLIGNGGSAAVAAHAAIDLLNRGCRAITLHDPPVLTCLSNDHGYAQAYARMVDHLARPGDLLIAISSSGRSANILHAVTAMAERGGSTITLSGFAPDNPLRQRGELNYWLDSENYGFVEIGHLFFLHYLAERLAGE